MTKNLAELQDLSNILREADFRCEITTLGPLARVLVGVNPYCVLAIVDASADEDLRRIVSDAQAELTQLALRSQPSSIRWDLYVLLHVRTDGGAVETDLIEYIESDTKYARKFVRIDVKRDRRSMDRALRPFLPLRAAARVESGDPIELLRTALREQNLDAHTIDAALVSFVNTGSVVLS